jgi:hypothetical protein
MMMMLMRMMMMMMMMMMVKVVQSILIAEIEFSERTILDIHIRALDNIYMCMYCPILFTFTLDSNLR